ncbi:hypothetical protein PanWU01x14_306560, partial [Parasponia andersonii]
MTVEESAKTLKTKLQQSEEMVIKLESDLGDYGIVTRPSTFLFIPQLVATFEPPEEDEEAGGEEYEIGEQA